MSLLIINTLPEDDFEINNSIKNLTKDLNNFHIINTYHSNISHCLGCCECMLSTPGVCCIQDDYSPIFKTLLSYDSIIFVSDTSLDFLNHKALNIMQRNFPLVTVSSVYKNGKILHKSRYDKNFCLSILYKGTANKKVLSEWFHKYAEHFSSTPLGVFHINEVEELKKCIF